jgi:hypothetical protein
MGEGERGRGKGERGKAKGERGKAKGERGKGKGERGKAKGERGKAKGSFAEGIRRFSHSVICADAPLISVLGQNSRNYSVYTSVLKNLSTDSEFSLKIRRGSGND